MISKNKIVGLAYLLKDDSGKELDRADKTEPFYYLHGHGQIVSGLESTLDGMKVGDKKTLTVAPEQGYGKVDSRLKLSLDRSHFPPDVNLEAGMQFEAKLGEGEDEMVFTIESVSGTSVKVDGNHPLAGVTLHFDIEVLSVRDATPEELKHGHAHEGQHVH